MGFPLAYLIDLHPQDTVEENTNRIALTDDQENLKLFVNRTKF